MIQEVCAIRFEFVRDNIIHPPRNASSSLLRVGIE